MPPIDPATITWDSPPQPVGEPVTGAPDRPLRGGVIIPDEPDGSEARDETRIQLEQERVKIAQEEAERERVKFAQQQAKMAGGDVDLARSEIQRVIDAANRAKALSREWFATGFGADFAKERGGTKAADVAGLLDTIGSNIAFDRLQKMREESPTGGALGNVTELELNLLKSSIAPLKQTLSDEEFRASMDQVINAYRAILDKLPGQPPEQRELGAGASRTSEMQPATGESFSTAEDIARAQQVQELWNSGATVDDLKSRGFTFSPEDEAWMRNNPGAPRSFAPASSGTRSEVSEMIAPIVENPLGGDVAAYGVGAANALLAGQLDELAPILGLDSNQVQIAKDYLREKAAIPSMIGEIGGSVIGAAPFMRGAGAALAGTRAAGASPLAGEVAYGALYGAGEAPEGERGLGAALGAGGTLVGGALANRFLPGGPGTWSGVERPAPGVDRFAGPAASPADIIAGGREFGVPVMTSDVMPPQTAMGKLTQEAGDAVIMGTAAPRRAQQEARQQAVEGFLSDLDIRVDSRILDDVVKNLTEKRSADLTRYSTMKNEVIDRYASMGDVPAPKAMDAIDSLIGTLTAENLPRQLNPLIGQLQDIRKSLTEPGNLRKIENNRKTIFNLKDDATLAAIPGKAGAAFNRVYNALNADMGDFIKATGNPRDFNRWKVANTKLAIMAKELEQGGLKRVLDEGDFNPATVAKMLTSSNPNEVRLLFTNLGKKGRENARLALIQDVASRAYNKETGEINPSVFAREAAKLRQNFGQFFSGRDAARLKGLTAVLTATRRAQESNFMPQTGAKLFPYATAGSFGALGTMFGLDMATGVASTALFGAMKRLYESPAVRDALIRIGNATGTEKARRIEKFAQQAAAFGTGTQAAQEAGADSRQPIAVGGAQ